MKINKNVCLQHTFLISLKVGQESTAVSTKTLHVSHFNQSLGICVIGGGLIFGY